VLESGEGTTSGAADQARPVVTWEIAPLRAAALRTERAVNQRWQTLRAAVIGGALLLGVIGSAAALSLSGISPLPGGMGFLSADALPTAEQEVTAREARDGVADPGAPTPPTDPAPPVDEDVATESGSAAAAPAEASPQPDRGTPSAEPQPQPAPTATPTEEPAPAPQPTTPPEQTADDDEDGLLGDLIDILLPGLLP
jgi:hypothetical protein